MDAGIWDQNMYQSDATVCFYTNESGKSFCSLISSDLSIQGSSVKIPFKIQKLNKNQNQHIPIASINRQAVSNWLVICASSSAQWSERSVASSSAPASTKCRTASRRPAPAATCNGVTQSALGPAIQFTSAAINVRLTSPALCSSTRKYTRLRLEHLRSDFFT